MSVDIAGAADGALAALALLNACHDDNKIGKDAIIDGTDAPQLVLGLVVLASSLRATAATALGVTSDVLDAQLREMYLARAAGAL